MTKRILHWSKRRVEQMERCFRRKFSASGRKSNRTTRRNPNQKAEKAFVYIVKDALFHSQLAS